MGKKRQRRQAGKEYLIENSKRQMEKNRGEKRIIDK